VDADGNKYVAKVVFSAGGGYYMFNENGQAYMAEIYDVETGERRGSLFEPRNFPALSDHGEPLVKGSFVQLAVTRCPASCGAVTDVYNSVASEINLTVHKMNEHADEHAAANAPALEAEANYGQAMRAGSAADNRAGPDPGTPVLRSLRQKNRLRYEELAKLLQFLEGKLAEVRRKLEACRCPGEVPGVLQTTALWGDPYLAAESPSQACLDTLVTLVESGDRSGQVVVTGARIARRRVDECSPLAVGAWAEFECAEGCIDVAISRSDAGIVDCTGPQYPIGSELVGVPARQCDLSGLAATSKETGSLRMSQSAADQVLRQPAGPTEPGERGVPVAESAKYPYDAPTLVAVIDSGIDVQHPALLGHIWTNPGEIPGNGFDDDDNGLIDDINGWNFVSDNNDVRDTNGHGTLVAGLIAAQPGPANDVAGVDPGAVVMALKVTNFAGLGNGVDVAAAITYAVNAGATIINLSLGGTEFSAAEATAARYAIDRGALVVVAAGNQGIDAADFWPAALDGVITVAATTADDTRADFSNWGQVVEIAAPGTNRISLRARYTDPVLFADENYQPGANIVGSARELYRASGTSFAAPIVAGAASRLWASRPELTAAIVGRTLLQTAKDLDIPGPDILTGYGLLDANAAMSADPNAFVEARIARIAVAQRERRVVQVLGSADAADFDRALLRLGSGAEPTDWQQHGEPLTEPVRDGVLAEIEASALATEARWTLRLDVYDRSGSMRTAQFDLRLR
jgi:subtilisin family serine protease